MIVADLHDVSVCLCTDVDYDICSINIFNVSKIVRY